MTKKLYVGNLPFDTTDADLTQLFSGHGQVESARVVTDRESGRSRGFAFVEMADGAEAAIAALNGSSFNGRNLTVNEARPKEESGRGGFRLGRGAGSKRGGYASRRY